MNLVTFFVQHFADIQHALTLIMAGLGSFYAAALLIVHITPTKKDDEVLEGVSAKFRKIFDFLQTFARFLKVKK